MSGARRDAEARASFEPLLAGRGSSEQRLDARDHLARVVLGRLGEEERELVAADAERVVALAQRRTCSVRAKRLERLVAGGVAEAVVQLLEAVEVAEHEPERCAVAHRARDLAVEARRRRRAG